MGKKSKVEVDVGLEEKMSKDDEKRDLGSRFFGVEYDDEGLSKVPTSKQREKVMEQERKKRSKDVMEGEASLLDYDFSEEVDDREGEREDSKPAAERSSGGDVKKTERFGFN